MFLGTYLLLASPLDRIVPPAGLFVPAVVGIGFLLAGRLFATVLRSAASRRRTVPSSALITLVLVVALCAGLRLKPWWSDGGATKTDRRLLPAALLDTAADAPARGGARSPAHPWRWVEIVCMVTVEEGIKLLPVFWLIRRRTIRTAGDAMSAAALGGLCFGMIEAVNHGLFLYAQVSSPATTYLVRALVMAPSHGIGAAIACGMAFAAARWRSGDSAATPALRDMLAGFLAAALMHAAHNGLQAVYGPSMQVATVFLPLLLLYGFSRGIDAASSPPVVTGAGLARTA